MSLRGVTYIGANDTVWQNYTPQQDRLGWSFLWVIRQMLRPLGVTLTQQLKWLTVTTSVSLGSSGVNRMKKRKRSLLFMKTCAVMYWSQSNTDSTKYVAAPAASWKDNDAFRMADELTTNEVRTTEGKITHTSCNEHWNWGQSGLPLELHALQGELAVNVSALFKKNRRTRLNG